MDVSPDKPGLSIAAVERETGLAKDTLRVWERRYGFPLPVRDALGERVYPQEQVVRLRLIRRLMDAGHRPGKIVALALEELQALAAAPAEGKAARASKEASAEHAAWLDLIGTHRVDELRQTLAQALMRMGMQRFVLEVVAPLNRLVGEAWAAGRFAVHEEHLYTEAVQNVLRTALATIPPPAGRDIQRPRLLLTTLPQESHALGLLMAEVMFALEGAHCLSLGVATPVADIVAAAAVHGSDVVALSVSAAMPPNKVKEGLRDLAAALPPWVGIWIGGSNSSLRRLRTERLRVLDLQDVASAVADWRAAA